MERLPISISLFTDLEAHSEQAYSLWMLLQGEASCAIGAEEFRMSRSDVLLRTPEQTIVVLPDKACKQSVSEKKTDKDGLLVLCLSIEERYFLENLIPERNQIRCNSALEPGDYSELRHLISRLALSLTTGGNERRLHSMALCYQLMDTLMSFSIPIPKEAELQRKFEIERYIRQHYRESLSLKELAGAFYLSPQYLSRYIKQNFGQGFLSILTGIRLDGTVRELREGGKSITQAALNNGFPNVSSFNTAFRQRYGMTPRTYLKNIEQQEKTDAEKHDTELLAVQLEEFLPQREPEHAEQELLQKVEVDCSERNECHPSWQILINLERASSLLDNAFQNHVRRAQESLRFTYGRIINVLSPEVFPGMEERGLVNFTQLNRIIDFMLSVKLKPFIELQPKPSIYPVSAELLRFRDPLTISESTWNRYMHELFSYLCKRWGEEEVETWRFELWLPHNEVLEIERIELRRYVKRFQATSEIIKHYIPGGKLGGPGLNLGGSSLDALKNVLELLKEQNAEPDFYSAYLYPAYLGHMDGDAIKFSRIIGGDVENWPELVRAFLDTVSDTTKEVYLTEVGTDVTNRAWINDTAYKAAVLVQSFMRFGSLVDGLGYWNLSDLSYEAMDSNILLFGGNGMFSRNGIPKSVFHAFTLLAGQGKTLVARGSNHMITCRNSRHYEVLVHNCKPLSERYRQELFARTDVNKDAVFSDARQLRLRLRMNGMRVGNYTVKKSSIEQSCGDLSTAVREFGCPFVMRDQEREYLIHSSVPRQWMGSIPCDGSLTMDIQLGPNEVALYTLVYDD